MSKNKLGIVAVSAFVIANMIGTGVFTSLGFQLTGISNPFSILLLWILGGVLALCGALVYGELGAAMPRSGGEYHYLSQIYHPALGFFSGWASLTVGFAAPNAAACLALGYYFHSALPEFPVKWVAATALILVTIIHSFTVHSGGIFQTIFTMGKILMMVFLIIAGLFFAPAHQDMVPYLSTFSWKEIFSPAFAVSIVFVSLAYSGWNAAAYIADDIDKPQHTLPRALLLGTAVVSLLYLLLNFVFLYTAPIDALKGVPDVAQVSAGYIFGSTGGRWMSGIIAFLLISTISAMTFVGPRVYKVMGEDFALLRFMAIKNKNGVPIVSVWMQCAISLFLIFAADLEQLIYFSGVPLNICTILTVFGVFIHRRKYPNAERPYKTWGYPLVPIVFLIPIIWSTIYIFKQQPVEAILGTATIAISFVIYAIAQRYEYRLNHKAKDLNSKIKQDEA